MDILRGCLDIFFRKQSPQKILDSTFEWDERKRKNLHNKVDRNTFVNLATEYFKRYSEDEILNIYNELDILMKDMREVSRGINEKNKFSSVFNLLIQFTDEVLIERDREPFCKYEQLLRWRMISHRLDQDLLTTAYLAYRDVVSSRGRNFFSWEPVIKSDNIRLHKMLEKGMAENHFHLKGSAPYFNLTWISLMNKVIDRNKDFKISGISSKRLDPDLNYSSEDKGCNIIDLVRKAAVIRGFLFSVLNGVKFFDEENQDETLKKLLKKDNIDLDLYEIQQDISALKHEFGYKFEGGTYGIKIAADYCIPKSLSLVEENSNVLLCGERKFMYSMFKKIYERDKKYLPYADLFYAYLVIKSKFRGELMQINNRVGFKNFGDYQDRKTKFLSKEPLLHDAVIYTSIISSMKDQNIESLEARICPPNTAVEMEDSIKSLDKIIETKEGNRKIIDDKQKQINLEQMIFREESEKKYFYVLHFPKVKDDVKYNSIKNIDKKIAVSIKPRDSKLRKYVENQAIMLAGLRERINPVIKRIFGIDACSDEIGCRPEVFAQAFRFLKNHSNSTEQEYLFDEYKIPKVMSTYHAGEDFLDLIDGLRAIDEAILFLGLSYGDRIGHAMALGVDVEAWYNSKSNNLVLPKQDYLDNIAWMIAKIREYNIRDTENLVYELENQFNEMFQEIYQNNFPSEDEKLQSAIYNHMTYYDAWKLRGDDPSLYADKKYDKNKIEICYWDRCKINNSVPASIRNNRNCAYLYYSYHYNFEVKKTGSEQYNFKVTKAYVHAAEKIQKRMQEFVAQKGIGIETNPSSNYLIGTFKRYDKHPIINFYNLGLTCDSEKIKNCPQMFVSINTDDQGVFGTYLENEYALLAIALEKAKDENGQPIYNQAMIYDWLDRIRQMGLQQSFMMQ
ncbi:hypothetical protein [Clostridium hydrogenum]|uniref:hypothetical protein n=1 Tax=Clostridium hydrogenum TaxID=2855764 RepID=UPI001F280C51|nr:hypothetical protein [Clostridium hydrogenum]